MPLDYIIVLINTSSVFNLPNNTSTNLVKDTKTNV